MANLIMRRVMLVAKRKGYQIFKEYRKLNIWGIRSKNETPNKFDDELHVFFNNSKGRIPKWQHFVFPVTTDPGTYWLNNPMNSQGTAMLAPNQYVDTYKIDLHRGKYYALCQRLNKVEVIRDYDRDAVLDFYNGNKDKGMFGINIHRARKTGITYEVENHSAGCQVFQKATDFNAFMKLCELHRSEHGNKFSYTLIDKRIESRVALKRAVIGTVLLGVLAAGIYLLND